MPRTRVYLTVDVECAEERMVGGRLQPPLGYDLRMWGRFANQPRDLGIGFIMDELDVHGFKGTFFLEVFGGRYFGMDGLKDVVQAFRGRGHDVQLHTHPVQKSPEWRSRNEVPLSDDVADYDVDAQVTLLREGIDLLAGFGVPRGELLGFRAGNFGANNDTWRAMAAAGMRLSSNFNLCYMAKNCRIRWPRREHVLFDTDAGVWELPVSNFSEANGGYRHLQITAVSLPEMTNYLLEAQRLGIGEVTIVTHSFEYFHVDSIAGRRGRPNRVNQRRLRGLCEFLAAHSREFEVDTVGALAARLPVERPKMAPPIPRGTRLAKVRRLVEQVYKRVEKRLPL